jgi:hypothetical protein
MCVGRTAVGAASFGAVPSTSSGVCGKCAWIVEGGGGQSASGLGLGAPRCSGAASGLAALNRATSGLCRLKGSARVGAVPRASSGGTLPPPSAIPEAAASSLAREGALESKGVEGDDGDAPPTAAGDAIGTRDEGGREGVRGASL